MRDYSFAESLGGTKGESHDFVLIDCPLDGTKRYLPIGNKIKLNKKRKIHAYGDEDELGSKKHANYLIMAPRGLAKEDVSQIKDRLKQSGIAQEYKFAANSNANVIFETKE